MSHPIHSIVALVALGCVPLPVAFGQLAGSRAGLEQQSVGVASMPLLDREVVEAYIAIEGRAQIRVRPTQIRVVLAITSEDENAQECQQSIAGIIARLKAAWSKMGIASENIAVDFIAVLPRYEWSLEKRGDVDVGIEKKVGHRMQTNVHLAVQGESEAQVALAVAFQQGVTDIIAFDYWSGELDAIKVKAREQALKAASGKADVLLGTLLDDRPPIVNVQEQTTVRYPESLYQSFTNSYEENVTPTWRRDVPFIRAYRPRNTYYRGLYSDADVQTHELPMTPEISVISTVRLYFESPAAKRAKKGGDDDAMDQ